MQFLGEADLFLRIQERSFNADIENDDGMKLHARNQMHGIKYTRLSHNMGQPRFFQDTICFILFTSVDDNKSSSTLAA